MSVQAMAWVLHEERTTQGADRLVMVALADFADADRWQCWPSVKTLAHMTNLSESYVRKVLARLESRGLIKRVVNGAPDERIPPDRRPNLYVIVGTGTHSTGTRGERIPLRTENAYPYAQSAYQTTKEPLLNRPKVPPFVHDDTPAGDPGAAVSAIREARERLGR